MNAAPGAPGGAQGNDRVIDLHDGVRHFAVDIRCVGRRMVAGEGSLEVKRRSGHAQWIEHPALHGCVVGGAQFQLWKCHVTAGKSSGSRHGIGILKQLAELARRMDGAEGLQLALRGHTLELKQPLVVLARHSGAGADQMFH